MKRVHPPLTYGQASCAQPSTAGALRRHQLQAVRPGIGGIPRAHKLVCCMLRTACHHSGSPGAAAVCACSAITCAGARGARRSGPHKCQPRPGQARHHARPPPAGCGPHATESTAQAAELGLTVFLTWDGVSAALLAAAACLCPLPRPPACMQRHAAGVTDGRPPGGLVL